MKTRQGFVSNSSTSSFVYAGYFLDANTHNAKDLKELLGDTRWNGKHVVEEYENDYNFVPQGKIFAGCRLATVSDDGEGYSQIPFAGAIKLLSKVQEKLGASVQDLEPVLIQTIRPC